MSQVTNLERVCKRIDGYSNEVITLQSELTAIPALSPENGGQGELEKAQYVTRVLESLPVDDLEQIHAEDDRVPCGFRPNILAKVKGCNDAKTIWILSHLDVVPPGETNRWNSDPYKLKVENGKLIGRGVEDNQQALVSALMAVKAFQEEGIKPAFDVGLAIVADEETGSHYGLQHVLKKRRHAFRSQDLILVPDSGDSEGRTIEVAEKSILWLKFVTKGEQCHASTPEEGVNAHKAAAFLITKLNSLYKFFPATDPVFAPPISTFEPTQKEANVPNINTIPGEDIFYLDCRVLPQYPLEDVEAKIAEFCEQIEQEFGVSITTTLPQRQPAAPPTPADAPVVLALDRALRELRGIEPKVIGIGGGTVAAHFREAGLNAAVWSTFEETAHQPNESCLLKNVIDDAKVFAHIFLQNQ